MIDRIQIDHDNYRGARLHNDLNKMVQKANETFTEHRTIIDLQQKTLVAQTEVIAKLLARVSALESAK